MSVAKWDSREQKKELLRKLHTDGKTIQLDDMMEKNGVIKEDLEAHSDQQVC